MSIANHIDLESMSRLSASCGPGLVILAGAAAAVRAARRNPGVRLIAFEESWTAVDRAREAVAALQLDKFISIHHLHALPTLVRRLAGKAKALSGARSDRRGVGTVPAAEPKENP